MFVKELLTNREGILRLTKVKFRHLNLKYPAGQSDMQNHKFSETNSPLFERAVHSLNHLLNHGCAGCGALAVLIAVCAGEANRADNLAIANQRNAAFHRNGVA